MIENAGKFHQRVGVNPTAREDEIDVVAVAVQLLGQPRHFDTLSCHFRFDNFADIVFAVVHVIRFVNQPPSYDYFEVCYNTLIFSMITATSIDMTLSGVQY